MQALKPKTPKVIVVFCQVTIIKQGPKSRFWHFSRNHFSVKISRLSVFICVFKFYFLEYLFMAQRQGHWLVLVNRNFTFSKGSEYDFYMLCAFR